MRTFLVPIAFAGLAYASAVSAQPAGEPVSVSIGYADLNMDSEAGRAAFIGRVKARAKSACGVFEMSPVKEGVNGRACRESFVRSAEQRLQLAARANRNVLAAD